MLESELQKNTQIMCCISEIHRHQWNCLSGSHGWRCYLIGICINIQQHIMFGCYRWWYFGNYLDYISLMTLYITGQRQCGGRQDCSFADIGAHRHSPLTENSDTGVAATKYWNRCHFADDSVNIIEANNNKIYTPQNTEALTNQT